MRQVAQDSMIPVEGATCGRSDRTTNAALNFHLSMKKKNSKIERFTFFRKLKMNCRHVAKKCCHNSVICYNIYFGRHIEKRPRSVRRNKAQNAILVDQPLQLDSNASVITFFCPNQSFCVSWTWSMGVLVCFYKLVKLIKFVY